MRAIIWIMVAIIALGYVIFAYLTVDRRDDQAKIKALFSQAAAAIQKRDLDGAISCVSKNYKDPAGMKYDNLRAITAQALRTEQDYKVEYVQEKTIIADNAATASIKLNIIDNKGGGIIYKRDLTVYLAKEKGWHGLIIPTHYWRVTNIDGLGLNLQDGL
ncbi:MAG: hypothetical protein NT018_13450 [Armatimonadetes bacterium]|nr:hypothetical protein [Armatimonadota bacterium]